MKNSITAFLPVSLYLLLAAAVFTGCASTDSSHADRVGAIETSVPGQLTIFDIPQNYAGGIIFVTGVNSGGGTFTYSPKVLQKIPGTTAEVKLYSEVSMIQKPFTESGEYTITVILHEQNDSAKTESRVFTKNFVEGGAVIRWSDGGIIY
jgi:hypothetical protein